MRFQFFITLILFSINTWAMNRCPYRSLGDTPRPWVDGTMMLIDPNIDEIHNFLGSLQNQYSGMTKEDIIKDLSQKYEEFLKFALKENPALGAYFEGCRPVEFFGQMSKDQILDHIQKYKKTYVRNPNAISNSQTHTPSPSDILLDPPSYFRKFVKCTKSRTCDTFNSDWPTSFYFPVLD